MKVSVILCTYNRCRSLATALESVALSQIPETVSWEVLVIDNNSKDETREVVEEFSRRHPGRFRYLFQPQPGKSNALNSGIREASGEILAFMDDDVTVEPEWLQNLTSVLRHQEWAGVGGRILPERNFTPPTWLSLRDKYALAPLAVFDIGTQAGEMYEAPFGTNMAFRRDVFSRYGGFRTDLGPKPGAGVQHNEDSDFGSRLLAAGERFWYEPSAVVYHSMPAERLRKAHFLAWWIDKARADVRQDGVPDNVKWQIAGVPLHLLRRLFLWSLRWMTSLDPAERFRRKLSVWRVAGTIQECHRQSRRTALAPGNTTSSVTTFPRVPRD